MLGTLCLCIFFSSNGNCKQHLTVNFHFFTFVYYEVCQSGFLSLKVRQLHYGWIQAHSRPISRRENSREPGFVYACLHMCVSQREKERKDLGCALVDVSNTIEVKRLETKPVPGVSQTTGDTSLLCVRP